jgi:RHS repeat-associated protein
VARQLYDAWGNIRASAASGTMPTDIGYTGQRLDSYIKLVQMGARWYSPELGRWLSPDTIVPDPSNPQSLNRLSYVYNNPLRFTDPTGHCPKGDKACEDLVKQIQKNYGIDLVDGTGIWIVNTAQSILDGLDEMFAQFQAINAKATKDDVRALFEGATFYRDKDVDGNLAEASGGNVRFSDLWEKEGSTARQFYMAHEMGHLWDSRYSLFHWYFNGISPKFELEVGATTECGFLSGCTYKPGAELPRGDHRRDSSVEDWAESFASVMIPKYHRSIGSKRTQFVEDKVNEWVNSSFRP